MRVSYGPDSNLIIDSQGRQITLSDAEITELTKALQGLERCPGDPTHYAHSHEPGGAWFGMPLDHGKNRQAGAEPGGCAACGFVHDADESHLMEAPREVRS